MAKVTMLVIFALTGCIVAEPPVGRQYLPPSTRNGAAIIPSFLPGKNGVPSGRYGAPSTGYGAPIPVTDNSAAQFGRRVNNPLSYNSRLNFPNALSTQYGAPGRVAPVATPFSTYGAPVLPPVPLAGPTLIPTQYGAPASSRLAGVSPLSLSTQYGAPAAARSGLSNTYGAPADFSRNYGAPAAQYGAPLAGYSAQADPLAEPANYQFSYAVQDAESGSEFGQEESRQLETAQGSYRVLLPDGRLQVVEYQADEEGYKPEVRYEETSLSRGADGPYPASRAPQGPY